MPNPKGLDPFPRSDRRGWPPGLRAALARQGRSAVAVVIYRRRGWNASAVRAQFARDTAEVHRLLAETEFEYENPTLF